MRAPAFLVAVPLLAGSAAGLHVSTLDHVPLCAAAGAVLALLAGALACALGAAAECTASVVAGSLAAGLSLGASSASGAYSPPLLRWFYEHHSVAAGPVVLDGTLQEDAVAGAVGVLLTMRVAAVSLADADAVRAVDGGVRLSVAGTLAASHMHAWRAGRRVRVTAGLREPAVYLNPGAADERRILARRGIVLVGSVKSGALVEVVAPGSIVSETAARCRAWTRARLAEFVGRWSVRSGGIATAILLGDRTGLDQDDERRLQEAGTYHVIAISGGNIAILTAILLVGLRVLRVPARWAAGASICLLLFYGAIVAPAPSVHRAITAATVYLAGRLLDQRGPALNVLATAAGLAVAGSPVTAFDPGFVLSFGATFGILVGVPRLTVFLKGHGRLLRAAVGLLAATVAAEVALAPIGASLFSRITIAGLLLNFGAIPLMSMVQAGSLVTLGAVPIDPAAAVYAGYVVHLAAWALVDSARLVDAAPWLSRAVAPPAWWLVVFYYAAVAVALWCRRFSRMAVVAAGAAGLAIYAGFATTSRAAVPSAAPEWLRVVFLDVGQGDSTLVILPDRRSLLVDAGGFPVPAIEGSESGQPVSFDVGARVIAPALRALGVRALDTLVVTHGDPDHIGGAQSLLRIFRPRAIWEGVPVPPDRDLAALGAAADRLGAERRFVVPGDLLRVGPVDIRVLHPPPAAWERQRVRNDDSVVLEVRLGDVSVVLPGDIGREGEAAVLTHLSRAPVVILKAPHHGSASSSTPHLLSALRPQAVVFSAGRASRFGHPAPSVVSRYRALGSALFSTAQDGAVIVDTDGRVVEISGWTGRRVSWRVR